MSPKGKEGWRAQVPPEDFAERATAAILRDRQGARAAGRTVRSRWIALAAAACLLAAGAAWALSVRGPKPPEAPLAPMPTIAQEESVPASAAQAVPKETVTTVAPRPKADPPRVTPIASATPSASAPRVMVPPCRCNAYACECGPEP